MRLREFEPEGYGPTGILTELWETGIFDSEDDSDMYVDGAGVGVDGVNEFMYLSNFDPEVEDDPEDDELDEDDYDEEEFVEEE